MPARAARHRSNSSLPDVAITLRGVMPPDRIGAKAGHPASVFHGETLLRAAADSARAGNIPCFFATIVHECGESIWPLRIEDQLGVRVAQDLTAPIAQYSDVIGAPLSKAALTDLADRLRVAHGVDALLARRVRSDGPLAAAFDPNSRIESAAAPFIDLAAHRDFETYARRFGKQTRRNRHQRRRRLEQACGALSFDVRPGPDAAAEIARAIAWKRHWLAAQGFTSPVFDKGANEATLRAACDDRNVHVSVLRAGGDAIAIEVGFSAGLHYAAYLGAYDPRLARFSAGQEQMLRTIEWSFAQGFARYDLLAPASAYKASWADDSVDVHDHCIGLTVRGNGYALLRKLAQSPVHRRLRDLTPNVRRSARRYALPAAGIGATAMAFSILAD
jgi:CelD/BcsL family acetyltransferase involved in cellulose biosynthesis